MSKSERKQEEKKDFVTIRKYFHEFLDNKECRIILFTPYNMWAANPRTKKLTRVSVVLPKEICNTDLRELREWALTIVAVPRKLLKDSKEVKNNVKSRK